MDERNAENKRIDEENEKIHKQNKEQNDNLGKPIRPDPGKTPPKGPKDKTETPPPVTPIPPAVPKADYATAIVGSWRYKSGQLAFGGFLPPTEFTKDGKVVQNKNGAWVPAGTYSIKSGELVVKWTGPTPSEKRYALEAIDDAKLVTKSPEGYLVRAAGAPGK